MTASGLILERDTTNYETYNAAKSEKETDQGLQQEKLAPCLGS